VLFELLNCRNPNLFFDLDSFKIYNITIHEHISLAKFNFLIIALNYYKMKKSMGKKPSKIESYPLGTELLFLAVCALLLCFT